MNKATSTCGLQNQNKKVTTIFNLYFYAIIYLKQKIKYPVVVCPIFYQKRYKTYEK